MGGREGGREYLLIFLHREIMLDFPLQSRLGANSIMNDLCKDQNDARPNVIDHRLLNMLSKHSYPFPFTFPSLPFTVPATEPVIDPLPLSLSLSLQCLYPYRDLYLCVILSPPHLVLLSLYLSS